MNLERDPATLEDAVHMDTLLDILEGRGCVADPGDVDEWVAAHALAHLALGHLSSAEFSAADEAAADVGAWAGWFSLD
jgi:hypothetical protein